MSSVVRDRVSLLRQVEVASKGKSYNCTLAMRDDVVPRKVVVAKPAVHAWTLVSDDSKDYAGDKKAQTKRANKNGKRVNIYKRLTFFHVAFLIYGIDLSCNIDGAKRALLFVIRILFSVLSIAVLALHWTEIVCSLKDDYLEYGSTLINLVFSARLTSSLVAHTILHSRSKIIAKLLKQFDQVSNTVSFERHHKRNLCLNLCTGFLCILLYCLLPTKYYGDKKYSDVTYLIQSNITQTNRFWIHAYSMVFLNNIPMDALTFYILFYDVMALTFFVAFAFRFYVVFRDSPFCRWLDDGSKHEIKDVMRRFREHHFVICDVVENIDVAFSPTVLIWYVYLTLAMCCWIRAFSTEAFASIDGMGIVTLCLIYVFIEFYFMSVSTSLVNDEVTAHLDSIRLMCINEETDYSASTTGMQDRVCHLSYITCVLAAPVCITGWGFFNVSKEFVLTVSSTVLTFTLVLYGV